VEAQRAEHDLAAQRIPDPAVVVLIGASGAGKSTWAQQHYRAPEVVSSDGLRAVVGSGERDLDASADAFSLLDQIAAARTGRGLATVLDTLGLDPDRRRGYLDLARRAGLPAVAVLWPPGVLAKTVATLDTLTGGRAFCGLGAGWWDREHAAFGLRFPPARERLDQLELTIETMRALWQPGTKAYRGERVSLPETTCYPRPRTPIPVIVGGSGERRTLRIAARLGDGCNLPADVEVLDAKLAVLREHCREAGRDPADLLVTVLDIPVVGADRTDTADLVERLRGRTPAAAFGRRHHAGPVPDHIDRYRLLARRGVGTVFVALPDLTGPTEVLRFAPVISAFR
jgi:hypothetical protein